MIRSQIQIICAFIVFKTGGIIKLTHLQFRAWKHNKGLCRTIVAKLASLFYRIYFLLSFGAWLDGEGRTGSRIHWHYILWKGLSVTDSFCMIVLVNPTFIVYSHQSSGQGNYKSRGQNNQPSSLGLIRVEQEAKAIRLCRNTFADVFLLWYNTLKYYFFPPNSWAGCRYIVTAALR